MTTKVCNPEYRKIIQGEDRVLPLRMTNTDGTPFPLTSLTDIKVRFRKSDNSVLELKMTDGKVSVVDATLGRITVTISATESQTLLVGERQDFSVIVVKTSGTRKVNFVQAITIEKQSV